MSNFTALIKEKLMNSIQNLDQRKHQLVKQPGKDFTRERKLSFQTLISLILSMGGKSLDNELLEFFNYNIDTVSASAFIQCRNKLLPEVFKALFYEFNNNLDDLNNFKSLNGYCLIAADGSDLSIPHDLENQETYFKTKPTRKGYNQIHINAMYDLINKIYLDAEVKPIRKVNELKAFNDMIDRSTLTGKVLVMADRGYESYNTFAHIMKKNWKFLIRVKDVGRKGIISCFDLPESGEFDKTITRIITRKKSNAIKSHPEIYKILSSVSKFDCLDSDVKEFYQMTFRIVKVALEDGSYQCFITNLDSSEASLKEIREYYHMRCLLGKLSML